MMDPILSGYLCEKIFKLWADNNCFVVYNQLVK